MPKSLFYYLFIHQSTLALRKLKRKRLTYTFQQCGLNDPTRTGSKKLATYTPFTPTHRCCGSERIEYGRNFAYRVRGQYGILFTLAEIGGDSTERVQSQYGLIFIRSIRSIRETCNHFQNRAANRGGSGRKSADTVWIQCAYSTDPSRISTDRASAAIRSIRA